MKVRYTASGARDFDEAINNLLERSPHVVADFANDIEMAIDRLLEHPYSAQETKNRVSIANTFGDFNIRSFMR